MRLRIGGCRHISVYLLPIPALFSGIGFQNGLHRRASSFPYTPQWCGCGETGLRTRIRSALLDIAIICNDFCSTHGWVPTPVSEAESSGVPRVARVAVGGASRAVPRPRRATCLIMRYRHIALDKYRRIVRPPPRRPRHARPRPAAALCDDGVGGPRTCLGLLWVSLQPVSHLGFASAAAAGHRRFPLFQLTEANFSAGREGRRLVWRRLVWRLEV